MMRKVSKVRCRVQFVWLVPLVLVSLVGTAFADQRGSSPGPVIEVFTSARHSDVQTHARGADGALRNWDVTVYEIDRIQALERDLSRDLPLDPQRSKRVVLHRIKNMDEQTRSRMQFAATALMKARHYGVDRTPAVVFDGAAVVHGVTDLMVALAHYRLWQTTRQP